MSYVHLHLTEEQQTAMAIQNSLKMTHPVFFYKRDLEKKDLPKGCENKRYFKDGDCISPDEDIIYKGWELEGPLLAGSYCDRLFLGREEPNGKISQRGITASFHHRQDGSLHVWAHIHVPPQEICNGRWYSRPIWVFDTETETKVSNRIDTYGRLASSKEVKSSDGPTVLHAVSSQDEPAGFSQDGPVGSSAEAEAKVFVSSEKVKSSDGPAGLSSQDEPPLASPLHDEVARLREENVRFRLQQARLREENKALREENKSLRNEMTFVISLNKALREENESLRNEMTNVIPAVNVQIVSSQRDD